MTTPCEDYPCCGHGTDQNGNPLGGAVSGAGSALSLLYGLGAFGKK